MSQKPVKSPQCEAGRNGNHGRSCGAAAAAILIALCGASIAQTMAPPTKSLSENDLPPWDDVKSKGDKYAASSGTSWVLDSKLDEMTDRKRVTAFSSQRQPNGAVVEIDTKCTADSTVFTATLVKNDKGEASEDLYFTTDAAGSVNGTVRVNDTPAAPIIFPNIDHYRNAIGVAYVVNKKQRAVMLRTIGLSFNAALTVTLMPIVRREEGWRFLARVGTSAGEADIKIPFFDPAVRQALESCD